MASNAVKFQGTILSVVDTVASQATEVAEINSLNGPNGRAQIIDVTHSQSAAIEKLMGLPDEGSIAVGGNLIFGDAGHDELLARRQAQTLGGFEIAFSDAANTKWTFDANVMSYVTNGAANGAWQMNCDLEISGLVVRT